MEILTFPNCRQSIWLAVFFILWTVIVQVICIISGVPSYLCATILYVSTVTILAIAFRTKAMDRSILRFDKPNIKVLLLAAGGTLCLPWVHALIYSYHSRSFSKRYSQKLEQKTQTRLTFILLSAQYSCLL